MWSAIDGVYDDYATGNSQQRDARGIFVLEYREYSVWFQGARKSKKRGKREHEKQEKSSMDADYDVVVTVF